MSKRTHEYVDLACMVACYALVAAIAVMVIRPDLVVAAILGVLP